MPVAWCTFRASGDRPLGSALAGSSVRLASAPTRLPNLRRTPDRRLWNDFEDTFRGPVHWDVASYVGSLRIHGANERTVREMLEGYGWNDEQELAPFLAAQDVYDEIWRMYDHQRRRLRRPTAP